MSGDLPKGWAEAKVEEICGLVNGRAYKQDELLASGKYPVLRVGNFFTNRSWYYSDLELEEAKYCNNGDLLYAWSASFGPKIWNEGKVIFHYHIWRVDIFPGISKRFLYHFFDWDKLRISSDQGVGSTMVHVTKQAMEQRLVNVPPSAEQHRIVAKIDSLFARSSRARDELAHIPKLIERYRQAVLESAFRGDLTADWRAGNHCGPARDLSVDDLVSEPTRNGLSVRGSDDPPGVPALRLSALRGAEVDLSDIRFLPITDQQAKRYLLKAGDVLISRGNGTKRLVARASLVPAVTTAVIFPDTAFRVRLSSNRANAEWFSLIWNAPQVRQQIESLAKTTAGIWKVSQSDISAVVIRVPDVTEQAEVVNKVRTMMAGIDNFEREMLRATSLIDRLDTSILDKAFSGQLVPQDPNDEPASKLLDRIRAARAAAPVVKRGRKAKGAADGGLF